jgi:multidrug resistance efflux pump
LLEAQATLARLEAGAWTPDIVVAERERDQARAEVRKAETEIERLIVRAPADSTVLRIDVREGEYVQAGESMRPPVVLAKSGGLEVRVQVDEEDASRVRTGAPAEGFVRGRDRTRVELEFIRVEPRVVPKTSITGSTTERVDTRVLFVVYRVVGSPERVYAGQKLDVFIKAGAG